MTFSSTSQLVVRLDCPYTPPVPGSTPPPDNLRAFSDSMPAAYRNAFDVTAIAAHARLSAERGGAIANVGVFPSSSAPGTAVCVVADDRPGLLATISAALVMCRLDVICGEAYTRRPSSGRAEAVDVFWLRHADPSERRPRLQKQELAALNDTLVGLLEGSIEPRTAAATAAAESAASIGTVVRFLDANDGTLATLEVETGDRSGLLHALSHALYEQGVQIVESEVKTLSERVFDRFTLVELDGSPISPSRRLQIQVAVLSAVEPQPRVVRREAAPERAVKSGRSS